MNDLEMISMIKGLGIDMIHAAKSGHPGIVLGAAPMLYVLYKNHMNINTSDSNWANRDRFVMSAGHGSALLYATLFMAGFGLTVDDLKKFRRYPSKVPGHPEVGVTPGVDCSTGPLGQGLANAVGMALGERILQEKYRIDATRSLVDYHVYALVGDGDLMEGISYEAASLAGTLKLSNLTVLYDSNNMTLDGPTVKTFKEDIKARFEAMGWETILIKDGNKIGDIDRALNRARKSPFPTLIEVKTRIGDGSLLEGQNTVHGKDLTEEDILQLKAKLGLPNYGFYVNELSAASFRSYIANRVNQKYLNWSKDYQDYVNKICYGDATTANYLLQNQFSFNLFDVGFLFKPHTKQALRDTNTFFLKEMQKRIPLLVGGSADLGSSTMTYLKDLGDIEANQFRGGNIWFGVREHAMGAILNGMALVNLRPYGSTFLSFSDYIRPAMRMSAMMRLPVTYIFTHDSISVGQDGPTHQPVEQLAALRAIPNMYVYRPADAKELLGCWHCILNSNQNPSSLVLARQEVEVLEESSEKQTVKGGYILHPETEPLELILVATGSEVPVAKNLLFEFSKSGMNGIRLVSMPCLDLFLKQPPEYQEEILPKGVFTVVIEAGVYAGWEAVIPNPKYMIGLSRFGVSGTKDEVLTAMNFSYEKIRDRLTRLIQ